MRAPTAHSSPHIARKTKAALVTDKLDVVADRGYFDGEEILACDDGRHYGHASQAV